MEEKITITLEEYKELLMIKGKYEELKSKDNPIRIASVWRDNFSKTEVYPYKVACTKEGE